MTCSEALRLLLEVDPAVLADSEAQGTELARHLRDCSRCRAAADRFLEGNAALRGDLAGTPPNAVDAARRARVAAQRSARRRRQLWQAGGPLAAAAVLAGILVMRQGSRPTISTSPVPATAPYRGITVTAPPGRNVAVLNSVSSDVVVIWFF